MRYVAVTEGDKTEAELRFGVQVNTWGVNELVDGGGCRRRTPMSTRSSPSTSSSTTSPTELLPGGDRHQSLRDGAAIELGLRSFLEEGGFGAFTTSFEDLGALKQLPGLAVQRLMAEGYGFGAEGDWKTAILVRVANVMGAGLPGGASLMEDYTYDLVPGRERILGAHMLEVSPSLTTAKPRLEVHALGIGGKEDPVRLVFTADPGPALVVAMSDMRDRFRLVANVVENVDAPDLPKLPVGRAVWKPAPDFATSAACWLAAGAAHHTVMTTAVGIEVFRDFAEIAKTELVVIDEDTTVRGFQRELRWNQAYYRLAQGSDPSAGTCSCAHSSPVLQHALRAGDYEAVIASVGATLRSLTYDGRDLVVPFDADEVRPSHRGATLAPWPNRVVDGRYTFAGVERQLPLTEPARQHALHGLPTWLDFEAIDKGSDHVTLAATIEPQTGYPWRIVVKTTFSLGPDGLTQTVTARQRESASRRRGAPDRTRTSSPATGTSTTGRSSCPPTRCSR